MKMYVGVTDFDWYTTLKASDCDEVNFWTPGATNFKAIEENDMFLFKLHSPNNYIVGGGFYVRFSILPTYLAWSAFGLKNGCNSLKELNDRIIKYRSRIGASLENPQIGCIILTEPFFFDQQDWIPVPENWSNSIVRGKTYSPDDDYKSTLYQGVSIPVMFQELFYEKIGHRLSRGETMTIKAMIDGLTYDVKLTNQPFDERKYPGRSDILQIRYDGNTALKEVLRSKFKNTWESVQEYHAENQSFKGFEIEEGKEEYALIFATPVKGTILFDCISQEEYVNETAQIQRMDEYSFENATDDDASIITTVGIKKIRHLSKAIGNSLKVLYGYRCQICGEFVGERYGSTLIHAHHIDYFTKSLNNDATNIMIVCPNHHGIIHDCNPVFNHSTKAFEYPNGYVEGLRINKHI